MKAEFGKQDLLFRNNCHVTLLEEKVGVDNNITRWRVSAWRGDTSGDKSNRIKSTVFPQTVLD